MPISGTLLNMVTVLLGGTLGLLVGGRLPERFNDIIIGGLGLSVLLIGLQKALVTGNVLILLGSILLGGIIGELLRLDYRLDRLGEWLQERLARGGRDASTFSEAFVTSSLVFCVGPLTILGSIQNGINGDITLLAIKSLLDGFAAFAFAATLGWGVLVSTVTILVYQGALSLIAWQIATGVPADDNPYILEMTAAGGLIMLGVGLKLLNIKELKLANYLPAIAIAPGIVWVIANVRLW
ncbi:MAG TPA: DUF554 domain-containing protein [Chloroflexia bacterium]|nr:DUF554 domain-containing protein [Chloroflexia bacterium]